MEYVWIGLSLLFFFSLFMLLLSVFTPKTALFFKDKTRLRGVIIWMSLAVFSSMIVTECAPAGRKFQLLTVTTDNATIQNGLPAEGDPASRP